MGDVEFLDEGGAHAPLPSATPEPGEPAAPAPHRRRRALQAVAALAVIGALAGWLATRPTAPNPDTAAPNGHRVRPSPTAGATLGPDRRAAAQCAVSDTPRPALVQAVRRFLPRADVIAGSATACPDHASTGDPTTAERVTLRSGGDVVIVDVTRHGVPAPYWLDDDSLFADAVVGSVQTQSAAVDVLITVTGSTRNRVPYIRLHALAESLSSSPMP